MAGTWPVPTGTLAPETEGGSLMMKQTLMIADGDAELCDVYRAFFTKLGYEVETASGGLDCLEKLRRVTPAVLVLDLDLPWGGGDGVLAWMREGSAAAGIPVVLTSTAGYPEDRAEHIEAPVVEYLAKPFALAALLDSVRSLVQPKDQGSRPG
jgi:DNA-binding response OmpR family regulator